MSFESFVAFRYLKAKKSYRFLSFLSAVSLLGIFISVFSFFVIHSVMNGFSLNLRDALVGFDAHLVVSSSKDKAKDLKIRNWFSSQKEVRAVIPITELDGIIKTTFGIAGGAKVRGLAFEDLKKEEKLKIYYFDQNEEPSLVDSEGALPGILVGEELYTRLRFMPGDEERVTLIYPFGDVGPSGEIEPRRRDFQVKGILSTGFYDYDTRYVFVDKTEASRLLGKKEVITQILVRLKKNQATQNMKLRFIKQFPDIGVATWEEQNKRLFAALKLERLGMILLLSIVTFVACFNVFGLMTLLSFNKSREMALLYSLGSTRAQISRVFRKLGLYLGIFGSGLGLIVGSIVIYILAKYPLPLPPAYYLESLPVQVDWGIILMMVFMAPLFSVLAALGPAYQASKLNPMEILRST